MRFADPWLLLLVGVPIAVGAWRLRRKPPSVLISSGAIADSAGRTWRTRLRHVPGGLRLIVLSGLIVALARPQAGFGVVRTSTEGVAIMMVLDRSSSMNGAMRGPRGDATRFEIAKDAFRGFVTGDGGSLGGREHDLIGMIAFARYPETIAPLSRATDAVVALADTVRTAEERAEDGTAIGDAVALAAAKLHTAEEDLKAQRDDLDDDFTVKSKVIILLTDGENNAGEADPVAAAKLAAEWGIKIYTIGVSGGRYVVLPGGQRRRFPGSGADDRTLKTIAEVTGGFYRPVEDAGALRAVYEEIDRLEKTEIKTTEYTNYDEKFPLLIYGALGLCALEGLLRFGPLRRVL